MANIRIMADAPVKEIKKNGVVINKDGRDKLIEADSVVLATGFTWDNTLYEALRGLAPEVYTAGVSTVDGHMIQGIYEAFKLGLKI